MFRGTAMLVAAIWVAALLLSRLRPTLELRQVEPSPLPVLMAVCCTPALTYEQRFVIADGLLKLGGRL
jgi:hypothetical protein